MFRVWWLWGGAFVPSGMARLHGGCLEMARFLCASSCHLMVPPDPGVKREDRCKTVAAPATVSIHHVPPGLCLGSTTGSCPDSGRCGTPPCTSHRLEGLGTSQETCHHKYVKPFLRGRLCSGVVCWRGARQARMYQMVHFLCHMRGRGLVVTAPCLPLFHKLEQ